MVKTLSLDTFYALHFSCTNFNSLSSFEWFVRLNYFTRHFALPSFLLIIFICMPLFVFFVSLGKNINPSLGTSLAVHSYISLICLNYFYHLLSKWKAVLLNLVSYLTKNCLWFSILCVFNQNCLFYVFLNNYCPSAFTKLEVIQISNIVWCFLK